jgi:hypothetical protein
MVRRTTAADLRVATMIIIFNYFYYNHYYRRRRLKMAAIVRVGYGCCVRLKQRRARRGRQRRGE